MLGNSGGKIKDVVDVSIIVESNNTAKIQEVHRVLYHIKCELVEKELVNKINNFLSNKILIILFYADNLLIKLNSQYIFS